MARAGHSDFATTQLYIDLSGEAFRDEAQLLEDRLWGTSGTNSRYQDGDSSPNQKTEAASLQETGGAGAEGLEPPAYGFGDRRSTN
jgi:hypothetical protein